MLHQALFEFTCELIDVQIKKYVELTRIALGLDVEINAALVGQEVNSLFEFARELLEELKKAKEDRDNDKFVKIFQQVRFYLEQEYKRGRAGWLLDENNVHIPEMIRLTQQTEQLKQLAMRANIDFSKPAKPYNEGQDQCEHDSYAIVHFLLNIVVQLKQDPKVVLPLDERLHHAVRIMRAHAVNLDGRYNQEQIWLEIKKLYEESDVFLKTSPFSKSTLFMSGSVALEKQKADRHQLSALLAEFQQWAPDSVLFSEAHPWGRIGRSTQAPSIQPEAAVTVSRVSSHRSTLFGGTAMAVLGIALLAMAYYFNDHQKAPSIVH